MMIGVKELKILLVNKFLYRKGGDAICALDTGTLLKEHGHDVFYWGMQHPLNPPYPNEGLFMSHLDFEQRTSVIQQMRIAGNILYSLEAQKKIAKVVRERRPDIVHVHNFAHQLSPSILDVFKKYDIPVVMTMHDYKLVCASYLLYDGQQPCRACTGGSYYHCFQKKCVKGSRTKSFLNMIEMYLHHKVLHSYDIIDICISPSMFLKGMLQKMRFKKDVIVVPNFIGSQEFVPEYTNKGYLAYFGRLSGEKGLFTLLDAVKGLSIGLHIIGSGPCERALKESAQRLRLSNVQFLGYLTGKALYKEIADALCVVLPSEWYENNPRSILEAFAFGKPVIGAEIGGIPELIGDEEHGLLFTPGNHEQLHAKIEYCLSHTDEIKRMGKAARLYVEDFHSPEKHYSELMGVYNSVIKA
jgi:glycosyltransferase involved in cell wall biosynthesis